ncbi:NAD(P)-binding protein [Schizopora paradoxa]|uniref:NAD(P)-binding protein n=1 Tax=Schizopora paradoxa TaxID=27342 RepID=A0A0H2R807_9AGAM|nr:NAD(P)-binding protein [Schizopora paradoxa]
MPTCLIFGVNGFVGGTVLVSLHKHYPAFTFKAIVRSDSAIDALKSSGIPVEPIKGSHTDVELVTKHVKEADVVVTCADSDNKEFVGALLTGLKAHFDEGKGVAKLLHTSGVAIYGDGRFDGKTDPNGKVWTDDEEDTKLLQPSMIHGALDTALIKAQQDGYLQAFIFNPTLIHGAGTGPGKKASVAFRMFVGDAIAKKKAIYIGDGSNQTAAVHVADLAELYVSAFGKLTSDSPNELSSNPYERYIIVNSEDLPCLEMVKGLAKALHKKGKIEESEPVLAQKEDLSGVTAMLVGMDCKVKTGRAYTLGWKPHHPTLLETLEEDVDLALKEL